MLTKQSEVGYAPSACMDQSWHVDENDGSIHITNDGRHDKPTASTLKVPPISIFIADCSFDGEDVFDLSNVTAENFALHSALDGTAPDWKLMEITIQGSGLIVLSFMDVQSDSYVVDDGKIVNPNWESVIINTETEHLVMLLESEGGKRQHVITQNYIDAFGETITSLTEIEDGVKAARLLSEGGQNESGQPLWHGVVYASAGELPTDTSPQHHTDQPGA